MLSKFDLGKQIRNAIDFKTFEMQYLIIDISSEWTQENPVSDKHFPIFGIKLRI